MNLAQTRATNFFLRFVLRRGYAQGKSSGWAAGGGSRYNTHSNRPPPPLFFASSRRQICIGFSIFGFRSLSVQIHATCLQVHMYRHSAQHKAGEEGGLWGRMAFTTGRESYVKLLRCHECKCEGRTRTVCIAQLIG